MAGGRFTRHAPDKRDDLSQAGNCTGLEKAPAEK